MKNVKIIGSGVYLPDKIITSSKLEASLNKEKGWTEQRTGIRERRVAGDCSLIDLYVKASVEAIRNSGVDSIDHITICQDYSGREAGGVFGKICDALTNIGVDTNKTSFAIGFPHCAGYVLGLKNAVNELREDGKNNALVVAASRLFDFFNPISPDTSLLWGDGSGALVLSSRDVSEKKGFLYFKEITSPKQYFEFTQSPDGKPYVKMNGKGVYRFVLENVPTLIKEGLVEASSKLGEDITPDRVSQLFFHQANARMIHEVMEKLGLPEERCFVNVSYLGNTGVASIPIVYHQAKENGLMIPGSYQVFCGFGVGMQANMALVKE